MKTEVVTNIQDIPIWVYAVCMLVPVIMALLALWYAYLKTEDFEDK